MIIILISKVHILYVTFHPIKLDMIKFCFSKLELFAMPMIKFWSFLLIVDFKFNRLSWNRFKLCLGIITIYFINCEVFSCQVHKCEESQFLFKLYIKSLCNGLFIFFLFLWNSQRCNSIGFSKSLFYLIMRLNYSLVSLNRIDCLNYVRKKLSGYINI